jgi:hypothetical protein
MEKEPELMDASVAALLGDLIGGAAAVTGQIVTAIYTNRSERRKLAVDAGFREWEQLWEVTRSQPGRGEMFPAVSYIHFNNELLRLLDAGLTPENYRELVRRRTELRQVIEEDTNRRREERAREEP